jgi:hypothetical protein
VCVCVNGYKKSNLIRKGINKSAKISSEGRETSIWSIRSYHVGTEHGANIITAIVTIFEERKFRRTLEHFNRHCNYILYYGIQAS